MVDERPIGLSEWVYCLIRFRRAPWLVRRLIKPLALHWPTRALIFRLWRRGSRSWNRRMYAQQLADF